MARDLSVRIGSLTLPNPVIAASGCFGYGLEYDEVTDLSSLGGVCVKGLFMTEREGHAPPRIVETPAGMINAIGLQGIGVHRFVNEKLPLLRERGARVFVNVCGTTIDEYVEVSKVLSQAEGVAAIELNISCPNIKEGGIQFGCSLVGTGSVVAAVRKATHLPVIPKLTPNVTDVASFARAAEDAGADAVSLVNTFLAMAIDVETRRPTITNVLGGLSGPAIRPIAVRMVWECAREVKIPIIGMGGITNARDAAGIHPCRRHRGADRHGQFRRSVRVGQGAHRARRLPRTPPLRAPVRLDRRLRSHPAEGSARMNRILVALDVDSSAKALALADTLRGTVAGYKIGKQLFTAEGPDVVRALTARGDRVFLDLKFHDIPNTVAGAVRSAMATGAWMVNVHASGGSAMMRAAAQAAHDTAAKTGAARPLVIGVTVLTSMDEAALAEVGTTRPVIEQVVHLARLAKAAGLDGVVASPQEIAAIRTACGPDFHIVTPGIRPAGQAGTDDQARTLTPKEAVAAGATYLVIGRPITAAADPRAAAEAIAAETA